MPAIAVRNVTQNYGAPGDVRRVVALENISFAVERGEFVTLLGPSGCGKSTLLNIIGGLVQPTQGAVLVDGSPVSKPMPEHVAYVFQESTLFPWYTVEENFAILFRYRDVARSGWKSRTAEALAAVGMQAFAAHYPKQLSVGMRQRINLARGIAAGTDILLMDEPFAALDEQSRMVLGEDLSALLSRTGKTILFVTHSIAEAVFLSDRIFVMSSRPGRIKSAIAVDETHPRPPSFMLQPRFADLRNQCYSLLRDEIRSAMAEASA
ncbi:MAG TPA: ABC transporter ATP-binding protein [Micropepsaceae bacterium]|nr:ABC transporter ATP-binding protein [Micropepsaceae bacterium]